MPVLVLGGRYLELVEVPCPHALCAVAACIIDFDCACLKSDKKKEH